MMYVRPLTKEIERKAIEELNEKPDQREECVRHITTWIAKEYQLKFRSNGLWLLNFIRGCKFSTQRVKEKFETYLNLKVTAPEIFTNRDPLLAEVQEILNRGPIIPFGTPDKECVLIRWNVLDPDKIIFYDFMKIALMVLDVYMNESDTCMAVGHYVIIDFNGFSLNFLKQITPIVLKKVFYNMIRGYPCRIKGLYFINCMGFVETLFNLTKPFLTKKLISRASFYGKNFEEIYSIIPQVYLPIEYGGNAGSVDEIKATWKKKIESYRDFYLEDATYYNDSDNKIPLNNAAYLGGMQGSFRKLEID